MHIVGADHGSGRPGWRESGLIEEFRLDDAVNNPHRSWELWDLLLYDKVKSEPNITLLLDSVLFAADAPNGEIKKVMVRCDKTEHLYRVASKVFIDCTGDSRLAIEAGAHTRWGREVKSEFNESLALDKADGQTLGSSILFTSRDYGKPIPFKAPKWARKVTKDQLKFRTTNTWEYGYWWIEWGGQLDTIRDNERIRFELLSIVLGVWDHIKNSGDHPSAASWGMDWVGMIPGKRESRRIIGEHMLTQADLMGLNGEFEDAVAIGGWPMDDHPPSGFDKPDQKPCVQIKVADVYSIPLRAMVSKDVKNLMMAGRNISASHVAFTSTRVMATCAVMGQAAGTAAALAARYGIAPKGLYDDKAKLAELQQTLLRDDQTIKSVKNADAKDLAKAAKVTASAEDAAAVASNVTLGYVRDLPKTKEYGWAAPLTKEGVWIDLAWDKPQKISQLQLTFDTGFQRRLMLTSSDAANAKQVRAPQPETVKDYKITYTDANGQQKELTSVTDNHQRLNRHAFDAIEAKSIRVHVSATNGAPRAKIFEIRAYA
jgi:hypothetical protein